MYFPFALPAPKARSRKNRYFLGMSARYFLFSTTPFVDETPNSKMMPAEEKPKQGRGRGSEKFGTWKGHLGMDADEHFRERSKLRHFGAHLRHFGYPINCHLRKWYVSIMTTARGERHLTVMCAVEIKPAPKCRDPLRYVRKRQRYKRKKTGQNNTKK